MYCCFGSLRFSLAFVAFAHAASAQIVPDGSTKTQVQLNSDGSISVGIAPTNKDGTSKNNYKDFNVGKPGVKLDNRKAAARTIVNEVTSAKKTKIEGPLEVQGQRAHVIIANPNGITVDGGSFTNTGHTVLTTGDISYNAVEIAPGIFQENIVSDVKQGVIEIGAGGLKGQMDAVDLIAHQVKASGVIDNTSEEPLSSARIFAGRSSTEFNSAVIPGNLELNFATVTPNSDATEEGVLVEFTRSGAIRANQVQIQVNGQGAGVKFAGDGLARSRDFLLTADGTVDLTNSTVNAKSATYINAGEAIGKNVTIAAGDGASQIRSQKGDIRLDSSQLSGKGVGVVSAGKVEITSQSKIASADQLVIQSKTDMVLADSVFDSTGSWYFSGNRVHGDGITGTAGQSMVFDFEDTLGFDESDLTSQFNLLANAKAVSFSGNEDTHQISAQNGSLVVSASEGDIVNKGITLSGGQHIEGVTAADGTKAQGAVTLIAKGNVINESTTETAIIFGASGDIVVESDALTFNREARIVANGDVKISSKSGFRNLTAAPNDTNELSFSSYSKKGERKWYTLFMKRERKHYVMYDYGGEVDPDRVSTLTATGSVEISGDSLVNSGEINANDGNVTLKGKTYLGEAVGSGRVEYSKVCVFTCEYEGSGSIDYYGGAVNAAGDIHVEMDQSILSNGGQLYAKNNIDLFAPEVTIKAVAVPTIVTRPGGLYNFWKSDAAWLYIREHFGSVIADTGQIGFKPNTKLTLDGGTLSASEDVVLPSDAIVRLPSTKTNRVSGSGIGLFQDLPPVRFDQ